VTPILMNGVALDGRPGAFRLAARHPEFEPWINQIKGS
jgi:hypothetical protein